MDVRASLHDEILENDLIAVINRHIQERKFHPQSVSATLAAMSLDTLNHTSWLPQEWQAAKSSVQDAILHMDARGAHLLTGAGKSN